MAFLNKILFKILVGDFHQCSLLIAHHKLQKILQNMSMHVANELSSRFCRKLNTYAVSPQAFTDDRVVGNQRA